MGLPARAGATISGGSNPTPLPTRRSRIPCRQHLNRQPGRSRCASSADERPRHPLQRGLECEHRLCGHGLQGVSAIPAGQLLRRLTRGPPAPGSPCPPILLDDLHFSRSTFAPHPTLALSLVCSPQPPFPLVGGGRGRSANLSPLSHRFPPPPKKLMSYNLPVPSLSPHTAPVHPGQITHPPRVLRIRNPLPRCTPPPYLTFSRCPIERPLLRL